MWTNPLDKVPQVPQDWANHVIYGAALGFLLLALTLTPVEAVGAVLVVASTKKAADYFKAGQSIEICVGKTIATVAIPVIVLALSEAGRL
jgi:hypothetical protein